MIRLIFISLIALTTAVSAQQTRTKNVIIITMDGLRWQEVFKGADEDILFNTKYTNDKEAVTEFWDPSDEIRREKLMPFFWNVISKEGQLYGNRKYKNKVNCSNLRLYSYPGYSEMLVGFVDKRVKTNEKIENPNYTVLEYINEQPGFERKVAAFSTWDGIPYVVRESSSDIPVNGGEEIAEGDNLSEREQLLNDLQKLIDNPHGSRYDAFTFNYALEYLKRERPRTVFISFDETDQHGHGGRYDEYLKAAHRADKMIGQLWEWLQSQEDYKDQTTLLITTDHGRGKTSAKSWKDHGLLQFGSGQVWWAVIGPDTPAMGEMKNKEQYFQHQFAKTAAAFLGVEYKNVRPVGEVVTSMFSEEALTNLAITSNK